MDQMLGERSSYSTKRKNVKITSRANITGSHPPEINSPTKVPSGLHVTLLTEKGASFATEACYTVT